MATEEQLKAKGKYFNKKLKAKEVLRLYEAGERNFQGVILRGQSFKEKDLSESDFSEADIRSANFTSANLRNTNFTGAKCGLQKRFVILLQILSSLMLLLSAFCSTLGLFVVFAIANFPTNGDDLEKLVYFLGFVSGIPLFIYLIIRIFRKGISEGTTWLGTLAIIVGFFAMTTVIGVAINQSEQFQKFNIAFLAFFFIYGIVGVGLILGALGSACCASISVRQTYLFLIIAGIFIVFSLLGMLVGDDVYGKWILAGTLSSSAFYFFGLYLGWRSFKGDYRDKWIKKLSVVVAALGGTSFRNADLTHASLFKAELKSTDFRQAHLSNVRWLQAKWLNQVRPGDTYLKDSQIRKWLVGEGQNKNFNNKDLQGINLQGANLANASFVDANLTHTDLSGATLTGACILNWNINSQTKLNNVTCDYVYLDRNYQERRPSDPNKIFKPGDFANLVQKSLSTVDLIFSEGIDWQGFLYSFKKLQVEDGNGELVIQAIERKTNGAFVVRVEVPPDADKASIEESFWQRYNPLLEAKDREIKLLSQQTEFYSQQVEVIRTDNTRLIGIVETMAEKENAKYDLRGAKFGGGFAADGGTQTGGNLNDYSASIGQNVDEINLLISSLRESVKLFPVEQREEAEMELADLEEEINIPEKRNSKRFKTRLKRLAAVGASVAALGGGAAKLPENINTFTNNVMELGEKLEVPVEYIKARLED